jgi:hypothetical protein
MSKRLLVLLGALLSACTTVSSVSISQIPDKAQRSNKVTAHAWSPEIILIPFGSGFVDDARSDLLAQCPGGSIQGLLAKFEKTDYFLGFYMVQGITFEGYCLKGGESPAHAGTHKKHKVRR